MTKQAKKGFIKNFIQEYVPGTDKINCGNVLIFNKCKVKILNTWFYNVDLCLSSNELVEYVIINYKDEINKKEISIEIKCINGTAMSKNHANGYGSGHLNFTVISIVGELYDESDHISGNNNLPPFIIVFIPPAKLLTKLPNPILLSHFWLQFPSSVVILVAKSFINCVGIPPIPPSKNSNSLAISE